MSLFYRPIITIISASLVIGFLVSCSSTPVTIPEKVAKKPINKISHPSVKHLSSDQRSQLYFSILLAEIAQKQALNQIAQNNYADAADKTSSAFLSQKATQLALRNQQYSSAIETANLWQQQAPNDIQALKSLLLAKLLSRQEFKQALASDNQLMSEQLIESMSAGSSKQTLEDLLSLLMQQHPSDLDAQANHLLPILHYHNGFNFYPALFQLGLKKAPALFQFLQASVSFKKAATLERLNLKATDSHKNALRLLALSLKESPNFLTAIRLKLEILQTSNPAEFEDYLFDLISGNQLKPDNLQLLAKQLFQQKRYLLAAQTFEKYLQAKPSDAQAKFMLASAHYGAENYKKSSQQFLELSLSGVNKAASSYYCADAAIRVEDNYQAINCFSMVPIGPNFISARSKLAELYANNQQIEVALKSLHKAQSMVSFKERMSLLKFEISFLNKHMKYQEAIEKSQQLIELEPSNPLSYFLKLQNLNQLVSVEQLSSEIHQLQKTVSDPAIRKTITFVALDLLNGRHSYLQAYKMLERESLLQPQDVELRYAKALAGQPLAYYQQMIKDLRAILQQHPEHYDAMNALGYTLADLNQSLFEAKQLIQDAHAKKPESIAILDSMGWVEFRLGNLESALSYLEQAHQKESNPEIAAHLGEVLWHLQQTDKAQAIWSKALKDYPNNRYLLQTLERFPQIQIQP